jgi:hypothetical protein
MICVAQGDASDAAARASEIYHERSDCPHHAVIPLLHRAMVADQLRRGMNIHIPFLIVSMNRGKRFSPCE